MTFLWVLTCLAQKCFVCGVSQPKHCCCCCARERGLTLLLFYSTENAEEDSLRISHARTWNHGLLSLTALQNLAQLSIRGAVKYECKSLERVIVTTYGQQTYHQVRNIRSEKSPFIGFEISYVFMCHLSTHIKIIKLGQNKVKSALLAAHPQKVACILLLSCLDNQSPFLPFLRPYSPCM